MRIPNRFLAAAALAGMPLLAAAADVQAVNLRGGLPNIFAKLERGDAVKIAYFGGSITASPGWRTLTFGWFQKQFPQAKAEMLQAAVGGTGSLVGAFRADDDLVRHQPDLVFVEFAVNDSGAARTQPDAVGEALEGIVRKLRRSRPATDIMFVYTLQGPDVDTLNSGSFQNAAALHERVAAHYGIPSLHMGAEVAAMVRDGKAVFTAPAAPGGRTAEGALIFTNDGTHPTALGHELYAGGALRGLEALRKSSGDRVHAFPAPLYAANWEKAHTVPAHGNARFSGEWEKVTAATGPACARFARRFYDWFPFLYRTRTPGSSVTVRFRGTHIGLKGMTGPDSGCITVQVDDRAPVRECQFTVYGKTFYYGGSPLPALSEGVHTVTWTFTDEKPDKGKILASYPRPGNDQDFRDNPGRYADHNFSAGQIILIGEILPPE